MQNTDARKRILGTHHITSVQSLAKVVARETSHFASGIAVANVSGNSRSDGCHIIQTQIGHAVGKLGQKGKRLADAPGCANNSNLLLSHGAFMEGARKHGSSDLGSCWERKWKKVKNKTDHKIKKSKR